MSAGFLKVPDLLSSLPLCDKIKSGIVCEMKYHFTKHAQEKFGVLQRHDVKISKQKVIQTIQSPTLVDYRRLPLPIAQSSLDKTRVLRVVYRKEKDRVVIITFYPGRKSQYEKN